MTHPTDAAIAQAFREYDEGDIVQLRMILARARELDAAKPEQVHTCSYYCDRKECLKAQRDELRDRLEATPPAQAAEAVGFGKLPECPPELEAPPMTVEERAAAMNRMKAKLCAADASEAVQDKYHELLYAVSRKHPGESRHETALRYIRQAESQDHGPARAAIAAMQAGENN